MDDRSHEELERRVAELEQALRELRREIEGPPLRRDRPGPSTEDLLRLTDRAAIPALIVLLETNIQLLRSVQRAIRSAQPTDTQRGSSSLERRTVERLDDVISEIERALRGHATDSPAGDVLAEATAVRNELEQYVSDATRTADSAAAAERGTRIEVLGPDDEPEGQVDVDAELDSIRREVRGDPAEDEDSNADEHAADQTGS